MEYLYILEAFLLEPNSIKRRNSLLKTQFQKIETYLSNRLQLTDPNTPRHRNINTSLNRIRARIVRVGKIDAPHPGRPNLKKFLGSSYSNIYNTYLIVLHLIELSQFGEKKASITKAKELSAIDPSQNWKRMGINRRNVSRMKINESWSTYCPSAHIAFGYCACLIRYTDAHTNHTVFNHEKLILANFTTFLSYVLKAQKILSTVESQTRHITGWSEDIDANWINPPKSFLPVDRAELFRDFAIPTSA